MRVIIAGSRGFNDYKYLSSKIDDYIKKNPSNTLEIISGTAVGADTLGSIYAEEHHIHLTEMPAQWEYYGRAAGILRNCDMVKYASASREKGVLLAFWDGKSVGTKHVIEEANRRGLEVKVFNYNSIGTKA